jgi:hypothetical protein
VKARGAQNLPFTTTHKRRSQSHATIIAIAILCDVPAIDLEILISTISMISTEPRLWQKVTWIAISQRGVDRETESVTIGSVSAVATDDHPNETMRVAIETVIASGACESDHDP